MKKGLIILSIILAVGGILLVARHILKPDLIEEQGISHYTCPMHPHVHEDKEGECPICHMKLVPVYKDPSSTSPLPPAGEGGISISPERQQTIGVTTAPVVRKSAVREIRAPGRVAFDPELAVAQTEFLEIAAGVPSLESAARDRLKLLGMGEEEIRELEDRDEPDPALTLPRDGGSIWVYAPLYGAEATTVKVGQTATITLPTTGGLYEGVVRGISPVLDSMTRSARVRVEVPGVGGKILPESFLHVTLKIDLGDQLLVPKSAVIETGTKSIVFVVHEGSRFEARKVRTGPETADTRVILEGLEEGETVATSAAFLIDSESQLKAALSGMEGHRH